MRVRCGFKSCLEIAETRFVVGRSRLNQSSANHPGFESLQRPAGSIFHSTHRGWTGSVRSLASTAGTPECYRRFLLNIWKVFGFLAGKFDADGPRWPG